MIKQAICIGLMSIMSLTASQVHASPLAQEMKTMSIQLKAFDKAKNANQALSALNEFQVAANKAKVQTPHKLNVENADELQAYQALFDDLNTEIEQAKKLVKVGQITEAKKIIKNMKKIASEEHSQYR